MGNQIIRKPEVVKMTGLPTSTIYRLVKKGQMPAPIKLSERASGWILSELEDWLKARTEQSRPNKV